MKVEKYPIIDFYVKGPAVTFLKFFGWWECWKCQKLYSPRVVKYGTSINDFELPQCSICDSK